jgi:hypothetical protein
VHPHSGQSFSGNPRKKCGEFPNAMAVFIHRQFVFGLPGENGSREVAKFVHPFKAVTVDPSLADLVDPRKKDSSSAAQWSGRLTRLDFR